jgi:hypothetical protein
MTEFPPDDLAARVRRLPPAQRAQAMAYVRALEHATKGPTSPGSREQFRPRTSARSLP